MNVGDSKFMIDKVFKARINSDSRGGNTKALDSVTARCGRSRCPRNDTHGVMKTGFCS